MKYLLVLGIEFRFFRKPADITVTVGDRFIDTFNIDRDHNPTNLLPDVETQWYNKLDKDKWLKWRNYPDLWKRMPSLFKVYEIDSETLSGSLKIKVDNDNTDYTNGFMRHSSLIRFPIVSLFNKDLVKNNCEMLMKIIARFDDGKLKCEARNEKINPDYNWGRPPNGEDLVRSRWPNAGSFWVSRETKRHEKSGAKDPDTWIGGSFVAEFAIKEKHKQKTFASCVGKKQYGFPSNYTLHSLTVASYKPLLNMYNEDK